MDIITDRADYKRPRFPRQVSFGKIYLPIARLYIYKFFYLKCQLYLSAITATIAGQSHASAQINLLFFSLSIHADGKDFYFAKFYFGKCIIFVQYI